MSPFLFALLKVLISLIILVWSADRFVVGAAAIARHFKISPLVIGMVIVGFGTSAPEMLVSAIGAWDNLPGIALGNAYGSNIVNIALILGLSALVKPLRVHSQVLTEELPLLVGVSLLTIGLLDGPAGGSGLLSRIDALILLLVFAILMMRTVRQTHWQTFDILAQEPFSAQAAARPISRARALTWTLVGLVVLVASSRFFVDGAAEVARHFGVSELVIGLTVVAVGTSLPELFSSVMATLRGEDDLAIGNIIGSNLFNTLVVVGVAGLIRPMPVDRIIIMRDLPMMNMVTLLLFVFCYRFAKGHMGRINRVHGAIFLLIYIAYTAALCWKT